MRYRNTGEHRVWPTLIDLQTGRTLELDAGEEADLAAEVDDAYLEPVGAEVTLATSVSPTSDDVPPVHSNHRSTR
jgi:hypothetical protein